MTDGIPKDLLGRTLTVVEIGLLEAYENLLSMLRRDDLSPCVAANVKEAVAALWNAVNDLALTDDRPDI